MEDKYPIKEIKIMDGVYIWKPELKTDNNCSNNESNKSSNNNINNNNNELNYKKTSIGENNYLCHGVDDLIKIYEIEFEEIGNKIQSLFQSNEDMLEFDPHDYDLIQAREENLEKIDKKLEEIMVIQKKMKIICEKHPIVEVDIFDYFGIGKNMKDDNKDIKKENKDNSKTMEKEDNTGNSINDNSQKENKTKMNNNIITEIEI